MDTYSRLINRMKKETSLEEINAECNKEKKNIERTVVNSSKTFVCFKCGKEILKQFKSPLQKDVCIFCDLGITKK